MKISFDEAVHHLKTGRVIGVPTETVYGLAACLNQSEAVKTIFTLKQRPLNNPLIIHIADIDSLATYITHSPPNFEKLAQSFWPGPLTCILPVHMVNVPSVIRAGLPTAGFRIPALEMTRYLIKSTGPLVMPSANLSGFPSATRIEHIEHDFGEHFPVLDGGICKRGVESTILTYFESEWVIVRLGALPADSFRPILGYDPRVANELNKSNPLCPGQMFRHYAPKTHLFLDPIIQSSDVHFILGFEERLYPINKRIIYLGSLHSPMHVAENLYQNLRQLDIEHAQEAWVDMNFPRQGLWNTIAERLTRASCQ